jgi:diguanylate cyclase (GGDEF)-like protein
MMDWTLGKTRPAGAPATADSPEDKLARDRLERLARTVGALVDKANQNERILRRFQAFELQLLAVADLAALFDALLGASLHHFQLDAVELLLFDPDHALRELVSPELCAEWPDLHWLDDDAPLRALYPVPSVRLESPPPPQTFRGRALRSAALLPLVRQGYLVGSLHFGSFSAQRFAADKSTDFINHLASIVAHCIENGVNRERLHRLSLIDSLTRVGNRRAFNQALEREIARAVRQCEPLALMLIDLDHFKQINDRFGHPTGDRALRVVAQELLALLRKTDHVCRYGGEEFALVLPNCPAELAQEVAERIRRCVASLALRSDRGDPFKLTLSLGVTCWYATDEAPPGLAERLVGLADGAVYRAKSSGRNRVEYSGFE